MIFDAVSNLSRYPLSGFAEVEEFLRTHDAAALANGRHDVTDTIYVNVSEKAFGESNKFEVHQQYIDLQLVVCGDERQYLCEGGIEDQPYDPARDCALCHADLKDASCFAVKAGQFTVYFPGEWHAPSNKLTSETTKKLVFKIPVNN